MANKDFKVKNGLDISTPLPVTMGGTGQTSTTNTLNSILPSQPGNSGKVLQSDGSNVSWVSMPNGYMKGGTSSRPGSPSLGDIYSNTDTGYIEVYTSGGWSQLGVIPITPSTPTATDVGSNIAYGSGAADITFIPSSSGGLASTFTATSTPSSITGSNSTSPVRVSGLTTGTAYTFTIIATNGYGNATPTSSSNSVTVTSVPQAPTIGTPTVPTGQSFASTANVSVPFTANATGGKTITSYTATSSPGGITGTSSSTPILVSGLTRETAYTFTVTATNANGTSLSSSASSSATPTTVPATISAPTATDSPSGRAFNNGLASISFSAPSTGGSSITGYTVTSSPGGYTGTGSSSPITVAGLQTGTAYTYTVTATNSNGTSLSSAQSNSVTATTVPGAPTIGTATVSGLTASIPFTAPASNGGSAITSYTVTSSPGGITGTGSSSPITVSGLTDSQAYTFTVTATNANGTSASSSASNSVTPVGYWRMGFTSNYPYNVATRSGGFGLVHYTSGPGVGHALAAGSGTVPTNKNIYTNLSNASSPQRNSYGFDSSGNSYWLANVSNNSYLISQDSSGTVRWQMKYTNGAGYTGFSIDGMHVGRDNNVYIWGNYQYAVGAYQNFFSKLNPANGNVSWGRTVGEGLGIKSSTVDANGNVVIQFYNQQIIAYNSSGTQLWRKAMDYTYNNNVTSSVTDSSGNFYIGTSVNSPSNAPCIMKLDANGNGVWGRYWTYPVSGYGANWNSYLQLAIDASNNIYALSGSNTASGGGAVIKFDSSGNTLWKRRLYMTDSSGGGGMNPYSISADSANNVIYLAGQTIFGNPYGNIGWTFKLPADGSKSGTYDLTGGGFNMSYGDSGSLSVGSMANFATSNNSYGTIGTSSVASASTGALTFTSTSNYNGNNGVITTI